MNTWEQIRTKALALPISSLTCACPICKKYVSLQDAHVAASTLNADVTCPKCGYMFGFVNRKLW